MFGKLRNGNFEPRLDNSHHLLVTLRCNESNGETLGTESTSTTIRKTNVRRKTTIYVIGRTNLPNTVQVAVGIRRAIVVDDNVDTLNINTTSEDVGGDKNTFLERFECSVAVDTVYLAMSTNEREFYDTDDLPLLLLQTRVDADAREIARYKKFI